MKKTFKMVDLDCANCAQKMEDAICRLPGVNSASVSFIAQKLVVDADDGQFDAVMQQAVKACRRIEPDCEIVL